MSDLYDRPTESLKWFEEPVGELFLTEVRDFLNDELRNLRRETDPPEIYRAQGAVRAYTMVVEMPNTIRRLMADKKAGRRE